MRGDASIGWRFRCCGVYNLENMNRLCGTVTAMKLALQMFHIYIYNYIYICILQPAVRVRHSKVLQFPCQYFGCIGSRQPEKIPHTEVAATAPNLRESQRKQVPDTGCNSDVESFQNAGLPNRHTYIHINDLDTALKASFISLTHLQKQMTIFISSVLRCSRPKETIYIYEHSP